MLHRCPAFLERTDRGGRAFFQREAPRLFRLGLSTELPTARRPSCRRNLPTLAAGGRAAVDRSLEATAGLNRLRVVVAVRYAAQFR